MSFPSWLKKENFNGQTFFGQYDIKPWHVDLGTVY